MIHTYAKLGTRTKNACDLVLSSRAMVGYVEPHGVDGLDLRLKFFDTDGKEIGRASIHECMSAELVVEDRRYLAYDGDFFLVDQDFLQSVNDEITKITISTLTLPRWRGGAEDTWLADVIDTDPSYLCLDRKLIRLNGETPFEACDLLHASGALIHAKRTGKSSSLSYVCTQIERACELLTRQPDARTQLRSRISEVAGSPEVDIVMQEAIHPLELRLPDTEVVVALLGQWHDRGLERLPLISKLSLIGTFRRLETMGFRPSVAMVDVQRVE